MRRGVWFFLVALLVSVPASAQTSERLPWFAVDAHAAWVGLPTAEGWVPAVPADTPLPGHGLGLAGGATVYPLKMGAATLGVGLTFARGKGTSKALTTTTGSGATEVTVDATTTVTTQVTNFAPMVSLNFGHKLGWSYLNIGYGRSTVASSSAAFGTAPAKVLPDASASGLTFGGGAKWFMKPHLGAGFDVRFTSLGGRDATATAPAALATRVFTISIGISIQ
jgi:hypothetical protein